MNQSYRIIVRAPNWIGDCVLATPFLKLLREKYPKAHITVLARKPGYKIFEGNPFVNQVWPHEKIWTTLIRIRDGNFDTGYILPNSFSSAFLFYLGKVTRMIGYNTELRTMFLNHALKWTQEKEHRALRYARLIQPELSDFQPQNYACVIQIDSASKQQASTLLKDSPTNTPLVALNPCSNAPSRRWPTEKYTLLAKKLIESLKVQIVLMGGTSQQDKNLTEEITQKLYSIEGLSSSVDNLCGKTSLKSLVCLLKQVRILITSDTGIMHIAAAIKTPLIVLTGAGDMTVTGPWTDSPFMILNKNVPCSPCVKNHCINTKAPMICMKSIEVEEVYCLVEKFFKTYYNMESAQKSPADTRFHRLNS
jgi:heptosyltransferase-2